QDGQTQLRRTCFRWINACAPLEPIQQLRGHMEAPSFDHPEAVDAAGSLLSNHGAESIPTRFCMNLVATVNVILYDRLLKREKQECLRTRNPATYGLQAPQEVQALSGISDMPTPRIT